MIEIVCQTEGPVAQLGARMTGSHEVESSNLSRSTSQPFEASLLTACVWSVLSESELFE